MVGKAFALRWLERTCDDHTALFSTVIIGTACASHRVAAINALMRNHAQHPRERACASDEDPRVRAAFSDVPPLLGTGC